MVRTNVAIYKKTKLHSPFGVFWNLCVNMPNTSQLVHHVFLKPHVDFKNAALLMCAIYVYCLGDGECFSFFFFTSSHFFTVSS